MTNYVRVHHNGGKAYIDYTGEINFRNNVNNVVKCSSNQASFAKSIYMTNSSPIYLKTTDTNHYIKYDAVYDGPQIGFFTGTSIKCLDNNAIILNASKTAMNINV